MEEFLKDLTSFFKSVGALSEIFDENYGFFNKENDVEKHKKKYEYLIKKYDIKYSIKEDSDLEQIIDIQEDIIEEKFREILFEKKIIGNITDDRYVKLSDFSIKRCC